MSSTGLSDTRQQAVPAARARQGPRAALMAVRSGKSGPPMRRRLQRRNNCPKQAGGLDGGTAGDRPPAWHPAVNRQAR